jgi:hypothetical protein
MVFEDDDKHVTAADSCDEFSSVLDLLHLVRDAVGFASDSDGSEGLRSAAVWSDLKKASLPFLRCAALFYHHLTCVPGTYDQFYKKNYALAQTYKFALKRDHRL